MTQALTSEQVDQVVNNTALILLARPDMLEDWDASLSDLIQQARDASLDDEAIFIAAVQALLHSPDDTLPTGTTYDTAWESLVIGLQTGNLQPRGTDSTETMTLDRLLNSAVQAAAAVIMGTTDQKEVVCEELRQVRDAADEAGIVDLSIWMRDALALIENPVPENRSKTHQGVYAAYWDALLKAIGTDD